VLVKKLQSLPNVTIYVNAQTTEITGDAQKVKGLRFKDRASGAEHEVELAGVFVQIGLVPNTEWLKGTVELSRYGEIVIDARVRPACPAYSPPATRPPCLSSRSSSPPARARRRRCRRSIT